MLEFVLNQNDWFRWKKWSIFRRMILFKTYSFCILSLRMTYFISFCLFYYGSKQWKSKASIFFAMSIIFLCPKGFSFSSLSLENTIYSLWSPSLTFFTICHSSNIWALIVLGIGDTVMNKTESWSSWNLDPFGRRYTS